MHTTDLSNVISKVMKGHSFKGDVRVRIEKLFQDNDWMFLAKTIRNSLRDGTVSYDPIELKDLFIVLMVLSEVQDANQKYKYADVKDAAKALHFLPALWASYQASDREYLYRRALESVTMAVALADSNSLVMGGLSTEAWVVNLESAALAVLAILSKVPELKKMKAKKAKNGTTV